MHCYQVLISVKQIREPGMLCVTQNVVVVLPDFRFRFFSSVSPVGLEALGGKGTATPVDLQHATDGKVMTAMRLTW